MIPPNIISIISMIPIFLLLFGIYFLVCWIVPSEGFCWTTKTYLSSKTKRNNIVYMHMAIIFLIWLIWGISWAIDGKEEYYKKYQQHNKLEQTEQTQR